MMPWQMRAGRAASVLWGVLQYITDPPPGFRILMYHSVGAIVPEDQLGLYSLSPDQFQAQIQALATARDQFPILEFSAAKAADRGLAITFDDGYRDTLYRAAPMLCSLGLPFTVFVATCYLNSGDPLYLSPSDLRELASMPGVTIGSHGATHCRLTDCTDINLQEELSTSKQILESILQKPVTTLSYPHGAVDARVRNVAALNGYMLAACSKFGPNAGERDPMLLKRLDIWSCDTVSEYQGKLAGKWDWMGWRI